MEAGRKFPAIPNRAIVVLALSAVFAVFGVSPAGAVPRAYKWAETTQPDRVDVLLTEYLGAVRAHPKDYDLACRTAQLAFYAWRLEKKDVAKKLRMAKLMTQLGKTATELRPDGAEGWHWYGAGLGTIGLTQGVLNSLQLVPEIKRAFERSIELNPNYLEGSALLQLARLYTMVPGFPISIGDHKKALELLNEALTRSKGNQSLHHMYIADVLWAAGKEEEALKHLKMVNVPVENEIQYFVYEVSKDKAAEMEALIRSDARRDPFYDVIGDFQPGLVR